MKKRKQPRFVRLCLHHWNRGNCNCSGSGRVGGTGAGDGIINKVSTRNRAIRVLFYLEY